MLAKLSDELPEGEGWLYEPKWDGFRALVFRGDAGDVYIQSRDSRPFDRYFPELHESLLERLPDRCVVDGEIVIVTPHGLDFDALQLRLHPAASRVAKLAREIPTSFVAFDLVAVDGRDLRETPQAERRRLLEQTLRGIAPPVYITPLTRDRAVARDWLDRFEGAGLDGVIAKHADLTYQPGKRAMLKIKQWVYEAGHPVFEATWQWSEPAKELRLRIAQKQPQPPFRTPLDVEIRLGNRSRREVVEVSEREHTFTFKLDGKPLEVRLDPEEWVLKEMSIREEK